MNDKTTDALGHNHEWDEDKEKGWAYCWVCNAKKKIEKNG